MSSAGNASQNEATKVGVRVMIVDDSITARTAMQRVFASEPLIKLVATAHTAEQAIDMLGETKVDVILLDLEMPGMGGLKALPTIIERAAGAPVLVVSTLTSDGAEATMAALSMGAAETLLKPRPGEFSEEYCDKLNSYILRLAKHVVTRRSKPQTSVRRPERKPTKRPEVIALGASTGGIHAICQFLNALPTGFDLPIVVTQHLPAGFMTVFARQLEVASGLRAQIAEPDAVLRGCDIMIAPASGHLLVDRTARGLRASISTRRAPSGCQPSVDPMLHSLAQATDGRAIGVMLSGMGRDGVHGAAELVRRGGAIFAQDASSSAVWGMPGAVVKERLASACADPETLAREVAQCAQAPAWN